MLKLTPTFEINYFAYFWFHLWNLLPHQIKESVFVCNSRALITKWLGPTCSCVVSALLSFQFCTFLYWSVLDLTLCCLLNSLIINAAFKVSISQRMVCLKKLYIHNVCNGLLTLVLVHLNLCYSIVHYLLYTCIYRPQWKFLWVFYEPLCTEHLQWTIYVGIILLGCRV